MVIYLSFLLIYDNFLIIAFPKLCCSYLDLSLDHELACPHSEIGIYLLVQRKLSFCYIDAG